MGCSATKSSQQQTIHPESQETQQKHEVETQEQKVTQNKVKEERKIADTATPEVSEEQLGTNPDWVSITRDMQSDRLKSKDINRYLKGAQGLQSQAVRPWLGAIKAPSNEPAINTEIPTQEYQIEHVFGYRSQGIRNNVFFNHTGEHIIYPAAALGVVMNKVSLIQWYFGGGELENPGHNDDIISIDIHPNKNIIATGAVGSKPIIYIWEAFNVEPIAKIVLPKNARAAKHVAFSRVDDKLIAFGQDNDNTAYLYDLADNCKLISSEKGDQNTIIDAEASPSDDFVVVATEKGVIRWDFNGGKLQMKKCILNSYPQTIFTSVGFMSKDIFVCGTKEGALYIFKGTSCVKVIEAHKGAVGVARRVDESTFISGGADGILKVYTIDNHSLEEKEQYQFEGSIISADRSVHGDFVVGTKQGFIYHLQNGNQSIIVGGHHSGEIWGLAVHEEAQQILTTGDDNKIIVYSANEKKYLKHSVINSTQGPQRKPGKGASTMSKCSPNQMARAICINKSNGQIALGLADGQVQIRESLEGLDNVIHTLKNAKEWIEIMEYSPNSAYLAVGSHDNNVYIYDVSNGYSNILTLKCSNSFITSLDWSQDSQYMRVNDGAYELIYFDVQAGNNLPSGVSMLNDELWDTHNCKLAWDSEHIWPPECDGTHINHVARNKSHTLLATGDDDGYLCVFNYPARNSIVPRCYKGHSEHVVRVKFSEDESRIYTIGGQDCCLIVWNLKQ